MLLGVCVRLCVIVSGGALLVGRGMCCVPVCACDVGVCWRWLVLVVGCCRVCWLVVVVVVVVCPRV